MADTSGQSPGPVEAAAIEALRDIELRCGAYEFYAALRRIECAYAERPRLGRSARSSEDAVRLGQVPSAKCAPAMFAETRRLPDGRLWLGGAFFGVFGPNGPLPLHLTEYAHDRRHNARDETFARFADIFHHRLLCLFYRGWADAQPTVQADRTGSDRFRMYVGALLGLGQPALRSRDALPDDAKLFFAGRLCPQVRNPEALEALIRSYFGERAAIREFQGEWMSLDAADRLLLGRPGPAAVLGLGATVGSRVWGAQHRFRIVLGPMPYARFERFLPGSSALAQLRALVRTVAGIELAWDLQLMLERTEVPTVKLGAGARLGWSSWLGARRRERDADEVVLADERLN